MPASWGVTSTCLLENVGWGAAEVAGDRPSHWPSPLGPTGTALSAAPLKGIPKQAPFRSPTTPSVFSPAGNRTPIPPSRTPLRKERGVKVGTRTEAARGAGQSAP